MKLTFRVSVSPKVLALLVSARLASRLVLGTNDIRFLSPLSVSVSEVSCPWIGVPR